MVNRFGLVRRAAAVAALAVVGLSFASVPGATAAPVPPADFTCGITVFSPCNQTAHFTQRSEVGTPFSGASPSCPSFVFNDFVSIVGTGNGVEHASINNAGDGWFTSTFTGTVTITAFLDPGLTMPDPVVPAFTGHYTEWFGGSFNRSNQVFHDTVHFSGTAANGSTFNILDVSHFNSTPNTLAPPNNFEITTC